MSLQTDAYEWYSRIADEAKSNMDQMDEVMNLDMKIFDLMDAGKTEEEAIVIMFTNMMMGDN